MKQVQLIPDKKAEELRQKHKEDQNPHRLRKTLVRAGLATGILGLGGTAVYEGYQHVQAQERPALSDTTNLVNTETPFDPNALSGVIDATNSRIISQAEASTIPVIDPSRPNDVNFQFLVQRDANGNIVPIEFRRSEGITPTRSIFNPDGSKTQVPVKGELDFTLAVGNKMPSLGIEGTVYYSVGKQYINSDGTFSHAGFTIDGHDKDGNELHFYVMVDKNVRLLNPNIPRKDDYSGYKTITNDQGEKVTVYGLVKDMPQVTVSMDESLFEAVDGVVNIRVRALNVVRDENDNPISGGNANMVPAITQDGVAALIDPQAQ